MKNIFSCMIFFFFVSVTKGQVISVEKSIFNIQTGFLGVWLNNESKLSDKVALRSEIGFDAGYFMGSFYSKTGFFMTPVLTLEPRWYYNLKNRVAHSKKIKSNSGNFFGIKVSYNPDWFVISNYDGLSVVNQVSLIPKWGIRRNLGNHFNFEGGGGIGYKYYFSEKADYLRRENEAAVDLHLRIGFQF